MRHLDLRRPEKSLSYSPLLLGSANEQLDKIMSSLRWDNEFYRNRSSSILLRVLRALKSTRLPYTLDDVLMALSDLNALRALAALSSEHVKFELEQLVLGWKDVQEQTAGLRAQLESMLMSDFGPLLTSPVPALDLAEAYKQGSIVYFALPVARFPETAPLLAKLIIADLNSVAGMVQDGQLARRFCPVVIDEFAAFATPNFIDLLNKARSAGLAITVSHQSMRGDFAAAKAGYAEQIAASTNIKICLAQNETQDAEYVAGLGGTYKTLKHTDQTERMVILGEQPTGLGSVREVDEYCVSPNLVRRLPQGEAVVIVKRPQSDEMLDVVALDYIDAERLPAYEPKNAERPMAKAGVLLRSRLKLAEARRRELEQLERMKEPAKNGASASPAPTESRVVPKNVFE